MASQGKGRSSFWWGTEENQENYLTLYLNYRLSKHMQIMFV
jgi:hypothetical protein